MGQNAEHDRIERARQGDPGAVAHLYRRYWRAARAAAYGVTADLALAEAMAEIKLLRYGILEVAKQPAAMLMGFDYQQAMYLYNSAYDPQFNSLSVGLLSKVLCIRESIALGRKKWDFLKGAEKYKYQLGGSEIRLHNCRVTI